jgi:hypothetical protein
MDEAAISSRKNIQQIKQLTVLVCNAFACTALNIV